MTHETIDFHGLPAIRWRSPDGASAVATLQGAHLVSWIPAGGAERLYVSERSPFEAGQAIRGGIPVVFPQFAERGPLVKHGFARTSPWKFSGITEMKGHAGAAFELKESPRTRLQWPHPFKLMLSVAIGGPRLGIRLHVTNSGESPFSFAAALHTYLRVADAMEVQLLGLLPEPVTAKEPIDRIFLGATPSTALEDDGRLVRIEQGGFPDTVVWNPGHEKTAQMPDMPPDGYINMLCVEAAAIDPLVTLGPGEMWNGTQTLTVA